MKKTTGPNALKMLCAAILLFVLSYFFNPLNGAMRHSLTGPVSWMIRVFSQELLVACGKFLLATLLVGLPGLLLGPLFARNAFVKAGLFSGFIFSAVSVLNSMRIGKGGMEDSYWLIAACTYAALYFLLGFLSGGCWGYLGKRFLRS